MSWTKAVVLASTIAAIAYETHYVGGDISSLPTIAVVCAVAAYAMSRVDPEWTTGAVMAFGYLVPLLFFLIHGHFRLWYLAPWKCALAGAMAGSLRARWQFPRRFHFAFVAWALAVAVTWPIVVMREIDWMPSLLWIRPATPSSAGASVAGGVWNAQIAQVHLVGLLWIDWMLGRCAAGGARKLEHAVVRPMLAVALVTALLAAYQGFVDLKFLSIGIWSELGRATGVLADPNPSGALAALWVAIPLGMAAASRSVRTTIFLTAASIVFLLAVWATGSRTALFVAAMGLAAAGHLVAVGSARRLRAAAAAAVGVALVAATVVAVRPTAVGPIERVRSLFPDFSAATFRSAAWELLWARNGYGLVAAALIRDAPLQGVGVGAFHKIGVEAAPSTSGLPLVADNAQNWYKHQLAELGFLGSIGWIAAAALMVSVLSRGRTSAENHASAITLKYAIAGFALASIVGMPGQNLLVGLTLSTFVGWLLLMTEPATAIDDRPTRRARAGSIGAVALAAVLAALTLWSGFGALRPPFRAERYDLGYRYGWYEPFDGPSGRTRTSDRAVVVPQAARKWLKLTVWVEHPDADTRPVLAQVWVDRTRIVRRPLPRIIPVTRYVELGGEKKRFVLETRVDRTFLPSDRPYGEVGLNVAWEYVDRPPPDTLASDIVIRSP